MTCPHCARKATEPALIGACASVGIESKEDTATVLARYLVGYHERGHQ